jgi:RNA ligase (TIGR02306 family)
MENPNSVCFVAEILALNPIAGADKIVQADISGWECVVQKDIFNIGDRVVIATTDAIIPFDLAENLGITKYLKNRKKAGVYTVRTTKLRGVYSQATIIDSLKKMSAARPTVGEDLMSHYGVYKYEEPEQEIITPKGKKVRYTKNPNFHIYHKFPNAKNAPDMFTEDDIILITNKIHGTNARYGIIKKAKLTLWDKIKIWWTKNKWLKYEFVYGSHQVQKGSDTQGFYFSDVWREISDSYKIKEELWEFAREFGEEKLGDGILLYGEIYGPSIQKHYDYNEKCLRFKAFDVKINGEYTDHDMFMYVTSCMGIPTVDVFYSGKYNHGKVVTYQTGRFIKGTKIPEEGVVVKAYSGDRAKVAKFINPEYSVFQADKDGTDFH